MNVRMDHAAAMARARTPGELVWHYATLDTLTLILQSNSLLATEVSFQNDIRETSTADSAFREALEAMRLDPDDAGFARNALDLLRDIDSGLASSRDSIVGEFTRDARFILCGTDDPDSLYAWRTYAHDGIGCAIGLDPSVALGIVDPYPSSIQHRIRHWRPVVYEPEETIDVARSLLRQLRQQWLEARGGSPTEVSVNSAFGILIANLTEVRSRVRAIAKDPSFQDEHEQRVTVESLTRHAIVTTPSSMGPRPHVRLVAAEHGFWGRAVADASEAPRLPIRAIRLGPNAPDSALTATKWLLFTNGYDLDPVYVEEHSTATTFATSVVLDTSRHPYRTR